MQIPFNKPFLTGKETEYIRLAVLTGKISGDGVFTEKCQRFFQEKYKFKKVLLTTSCTDALEMAAILLNIKEGDEVIAPSYAFVSTVNAFVLRGARIIFADSTAANPNMDVKSIENLISPRTKAISLIHYGGIACDMDELKKIADNKNIPVIEDAAQCIDSYYKGVPLGSLGAMSTFSFHETKNIQCGEGGMIVLNNEKHFHRAEIIREKGTNRSAFFRGEVTKYEWIDMGSSFLPSEITAAFLFAQIENLSRIQKQRKKIWELYQQLLLPLSEQGKIDMPLIPEYATNNAHLFYIICKEEDKRDKLLLHLRKNNIHAVIHYQSLHKSPYYKDKYEGGEMKWADYYSDNLLRLPMYYELKESQVEYICDKVKNFFKG